MANVKMNIEYRVRAIDAFTKVHKRLTRQLETLEKQLDRVSKTREIKIDADTLAAVKKLDKVEKEVKDIPRFKVITIIANTHKDFRRTMDRVADFSRDMGEITQGFLVGSIFTALGPALQVTAGGLGAITAAATPAALGLGGLLAVGVPALTELTDKYGDLKDAREKLADAKTEKEIAKATEELAEAQSKLSSSQVKAADAMDRFGKFFDEFSKKFETPMLEIFTKALDTAQNLLTTLEPAIQSTAHAVKDIFDAFNQNLNTADMKEFFKWVGRTAGPYLEMLTKALGNFIAGIGNMLVAFDPLAKSFLEGFMDMSKSFRDWAANLEKNKGFQDFLQNVREYTPVVLTLIGDLVEFFWRFLDAMAPFSALIMQFTSWWLELLSTWMETSTVGKVVMGVFGTIIGLFMMIGPIVFLIVSVFRTALWPALKFLSSILMRVVFTVFRFLGPWSLVIYIVGVVAAAIISNWDKIIEWTKKTFGSFAEAIKLGMETMSKNVSAVLELIKTTFSNALKFLKALITLDFQGMKDAVSNQMNAMKSTATEIWQNIEDYFANIDLKQIGADIINGMIDGIKSMGSSLVSAAKGVVDDAIQGAKKLLGIKSPSKLFFGFGEFVDEGFINGMLSMTKQVNRASEKMVGAAIPNLSDLPTPQYQGARLSSAPSNRGAAQTYSYGGDTHNYRGMLEGASFVVREEADIDKIATALAKKTKQAQRGRGQRSR